MFLTLSIRERGSKRDGESMLKASTTKPLLATPSFIPCLKQKANKNRVPQSALMNTCFFIRNIGSTEGFVGHHLT